MYQSLLTRRYLTRRIMPLLSAIAVALSVAMVLITWSVMGGFLRVLLESGKTFVGDVKIQYPNRGFAHYEDLIERLEADPMVAAATPVIETFGMVSLPGGRVEGVMVLGVEPEGYDQVTGYYQTLHWRPVEEPAPRDVHGRDLRVQPLANSAAGLEYEGLGPRGRQRVLEWTWQDVLEHGRRLHRPDPASGEMQPAVALGIEMSRLNVREQGWYDVFTPAVTTDAGTVVYPKVFMPVNGRVTLRVLPLDQQGRTIDVASRIMPVANEFQTGNYEFDSKMVLMPLETLQEMLRMNAARRVVDGGGGGIQIDPETGEERFAEVETTLDPARVTTVLVKGAPGVAAPELRERAGMIYAAFAAEHPRGAPPPQMMTIATWEEINAQFIGAVKKEIALVLVLFSFISITAVFLVLSIFWSMVNEKTKDIGVLRALGAGRSGVAWLWIRYGLVIGIAGSALGGVISWLIVRNINPIHEWLGRTLGIVVWDPRVYYFTEIPNEIDPAAAAIVLGGGIIAATIGAVVPAIRAANMDPVRALRFE